jgi:protein-disulfide isomerase
MTQNYKAPRLTLPVGERDHFEGPTDARMVLVEYGDYQCPYCGAAYPIAKRIQKELGTRLKFVFRNFPLTNSHP